MTLATLKQMLSIQESTLKSTFESFIMSVNHRVDDLVKTVAEVKSRVVLHAVKLAHSERLGRLCSDTRKIALFFMLSNWRFGKCMT